MKLVASVKWAENPAEEAKAKRSGEKLSKAVASGQAKTSTGFSNLKADLEDVKKGLEAAGVSADKFGKVAGALAGGGKLAAVAALASAAGMALKKLWDRLTLSAGEYLKVQDAIYRDSKNKTDSELKQQGVDSGYMDSLQQLSQTETLSNEQKKYAVTLIQLLTKNYGDLGLAIDSTTGKITGLEKAQEVMLKKQSKRNLQNLETELKDISGLGEKRLEMLLVQMNKIIGFDPIAEGLYQGFGITTGGVKDAQKQISALSTEDQIKALTALRNSHIKTEEELEAVQKVIDLKKQQLEIEKQISSLKKNGVLSDEDLAKKLKEAAEKSRATKAIQETEAEKKRGKTLAEQNAKARENFAYGRLETDSERLEFWEKKRNAELQKQGNLQTQNQTLQNKVYGDEGRIEYDKRRIEYLKKVAPNDPEILQLQGKVYKFDAERANDGLQIAKNENLIQESLAEQLKIETEIFKLKKRSQDFYKGAKDSIEQELEIQKLCLQGKFKEAEQQKILNDLKKQGLQIDLKEVQTIADLKEKMARFNVDKDLKNSFGKLADQLQPQTVSSVAQQRIKALEEANQVSLTDKQKKSVEKLVKIEFEMKKIKSVDSFESITNDLTRRGGFKGGYSNNLDRIQQQIASNTKTSNELLKQCLIEQRKFNDF